MKKLFSLLIVTMLLLLSGQYLKAQCGAPMSQPQYLNLTPDNTTVTGSFKPPTTADADHYLIIRSSTSASLPPYPSTYQMYNAGDLLGEFTVVSYQTELTFIDVNLSPGVTYYYSIFAANSCPYGPDYEIADIPLSSYTTTLTPVSKTLNVTVMLQDYYDSGSGLMTPTQDVDTYGNPFDKWSEVEYLTSSVIVDTLTILIRSTAPPDYAIEQECHGLYLKPDGTIIMFQNVTGIPLINAEEITGYHYIVVKHRCSVETWSDPVDFTLSSPISYNFYTQAPSTIFPNNMANFDNYQNPVSGSLIWGGDANQDGYVDLMDIAMVYEGNINILDGYNVLDVNGDGWVTLDDVFVAYYSNENLAQTINPFTY